MSLVLKLTKGKRSLDLTSGRYKPAESFVPPVSQISTLIASSTSANRYDSGEKISERLSPHGFGLPLQLRGNSAADINDAARVLANFLSQAGDKVEPVYLEHRSAAALDAEPLWGQLGANMRYEVIGANVPTPAPIYGEGDMRTKHVPINVSLTLKPTAVGKKQRLASATGGVLESGVGTVDGNSRGLAIPGEAANGTTDNEFKNPIFGASTFDNGWTAGAATLAVSEINDPNLVLFGLSSALLSSTDAGDVTFSNGTAKIATTNKYLISCYARRLDEEAVTTADLEIYWGRGGTGHLTATTVESVGNNWYLLWAIANSDATPYNAGVTVKAGMEVVVDGFMIGETNFNRLPTTFFYGDMLGCYWIGTIHDSWSERLPARVRIAGDNLSPHTGTLRVVWEPEADSAAYLFTTSLYLAQSTDGDFSLRYLTATDELEFDFTAASIKGSLTLVRGEPLVIHLVWGAGDASLYVDGALLVTTSSYAPATIGDYLYIGSDNTEALQSGGLYMDFVTYHADMTATEVSDDFALVDGIITSGSRAGSIPWLWTKDGDDVVDNCDDTSRDNFMVCGGVPGNVEAETITRFLPSADEDFYWLGNKAIEYGRYIHPSPSQWMLDYQGTADATYCGGEYELYIPVSAWERSMTVTEPGIVNGNTHIFLRIGGNGGSPTPDIYPFYKFGSSGASVVGETKELTLAPTADFYYLGEVFIGFHKNISVTDFSLEVGFGSAAGTTVRLDYLMLVNGQLLRIATGGTAVDSIVVNSAFAQDIAAAGLGRVLQSAGDEFNLIPHSLNNVWFMSSGANTITTTYTIERMEIIPRYTTI